MGGFGPDGINMLPLWTQKKKEDGIGVEKRAHSCAERRRQTAVRMGLNQSFAFDDLKAPWEQQQDNLTECMDEADTEHPDTACRFSSKELQEHRCPASSVPALKLKHFYDGIADLSAYLPPAHSLEHIP